MKKLITILTICAILFAFCICAVFASATKGEPCTNSYTCTGEAVYENGICPQCKGYQTATLNNDGYYEIDNAGKLYWFAERVNEGETSINAILTDDIIVNEGVMTESSSTEFEWTPIGNESNQYIGTFDGNGKTISGLYFNDPSISNVGLFGYIGEDEENYGTVKNVGVIDSYFKGDASVGGVVGNVQGSSVNVLNCYNTGSVNGKDANIGGVVGYNYWGTVKYCYNTGKVSGDWNHVGGVVGYNGGFVENCFNQGTVNGANIGIGGIAGLNFGSEITNCYNFGSVTGDENCVGGVVGYSDSHSIVTNCYYLIECARDGNNTVQCGIGNENKGSATEDAVGQTESKTSMQFSSGEVAYLLGEEWGQIIGIDYNPKFATENNKVYYGYTTCNPSQTKPIYTNSSAVTETKHDYEEAFAHDGSYKCAVCGWLDRNSSVLKAPKQYTDHQGTHITVGYEVLNFPSFRRDSATITLKGGFLDKDVTLGLFNGRLVTKNGNVLSYGEKNTIGYVGAELVDGLLSFKYAFPPANEDHVAGEDVTLSYTIRYYSEDGFEDEKSGDLDLKYVNYGLYTQMTEYGATLNLNFYSTQGTVIKSNDYNVGNYSVTISDYYGSKKEYTYRIEENFDVGTSITRENTENGIVITIERNDGNSVIVTPPEGTSGVTVKDNGRPCVKVTVTESVKLSYKHINHEGEETVRFISIDLSTAPQQKPILEQLGYTTVDWNDDSEYALASDNLTKYRVGNVTVYLTNCIFKSTRSMVCFTFTPGGVTSHTFSKDDILLIENDSEYELTEDVTVSLGAILVNDHVFLDATCTDPKTCKYCSYTEGEPNGHDMQEATCTNPKTCKYCSYTEGEPNGHDMQEATCTNPKSCKNCSYTEGEPKGHNMQEATCTNPKSCKNCSYTEGEPKGHDMKEATCTNTKACKNCSYTEGEPNGHDMQEATCINPKACKNCSYTEGELTDHKYDNNCDPTCNNCGESRTPAEHTDADKNLICDECGVDLPNNGGAQVGTIVGIIIGSAIALGGGFALFWFVIRKRKFNN